MKKFALLISLFLLAGVIALQSGRAAGDTGHVTASETAPASVATTPAPCLPDDPFQLADLRDIISSHNPPTAIQHINAFLSVEWMGVGQLVDLPFDDEEPDYDNIEPSTIPEPPDATMSEARIRVFNTETLNEFRIIMQPEMLEDIHNCHEEAGITRGAISFDDQWTLDHPGLFLPTLFNGQSPTGGSSQAQPMVIADGVDTRIKRDGRYALPWRTITQFRSVDSVSHISNCTGTLVGPRHIITAAHCVNQKDTWNWSSVVVTPGKYGVGTGADQEPYGHSVMPTPGKAAWYFTPEEWRDPDFPRSAVYDWAFIVIPDRLGDAAAWMGYVIKPLNTLYELNHYNRGYPRCSAAGPPGCETAHMYGGKVCYVANGYSPGPDGWNRGVAHDCDTNGGQSGSALYHYHFDGQKIWAVVGAVHSGGGAGCSGIPCAEGERFVNFAHRLTPSDLGIIASLREKFP